MACADLVLSFFNQGDIKSIIADIMRDLKPLHY